MDLANVCVFYANVFLTACLAVTTFFLIMFEDSGLRLSTWIAKISSFAHCNK